MDKQMTGLSVSFCIADIIAGRVLEEDVYMIIGGTCCQDEYEWNKVADDYAKNYWRQDPKQGKEILFRLLAAGKIDQPRLRFEQPESIHGGWWR